MKNKVEYKIYDPQTDTFETIHDAIVPAVGEDNYDETLDNAVLRIDGSLNGNRFPKGLRISLFVNDNEWRKYVVEEDIVTRQRNVEPFIYSHSVALIEPLKMTEGDILSNVSFSYYKPYAKPISKIEDFDMIRINPDASYYLTNDIIADPNEEFEYIPGCNSFDGRGYKIENVYINRIAPLPSLSGPLKDGFGFFANIGTLKNVTFKNLRVNLGDQSDSDIIGGAFGAVAGWANNVYNCRLITDRQINIIAPGEARVGSMFGMVRNLYNSEMIITGPNFLRIIPKEAGPYFIHRYLLGGMAGMVARVINVSATGRVNFYISDTGVNTEIYAGAFAGEITNQYPNSPPRVERILTNIEVASYTALFGVLGSQTTSADIVQPPGVQVAIFGTSFVNSSKLEEINSTTMLYDPFSTSYFSNKVTSDVIANEALYRNNSWDLDNLWVMNGTVHDHTEEGKDVHPILREFTKGRLDGSYSIKNVLQRIIDVSDIRLNKYNEETGEFEKQKSKYKLSQNLIDFLDSNDYYSKSPEFFFHDLTQQECFFQVGTYLNAIPVINNNELDYLFLNRDEIEISQLQNVAEIIRQSGAQYSTELISFNDNVVTESDEDRSTIVYPYPGGYITPRTDNAAKARISNETATFEVPFDIYDVKELKAIYEGVEYNLTPFLYEKRIYDTLSDTPNGKGKAIIFDQYDRFIYGFTEQPVRGFAPPYPALGNIMKSINSDIDVIGLKIKDIQFQITYLTRYNNIEKAVREYAEDFPNHFGLIINQDDNITNSENLAKFKQNKLNKMGNIEHEYHYEAESYLDIPAKGTIIDGNYVNKVEWEIYPEMVRFNIEFSKDFNKIGEFKDINRRKRPFPIPADLLEDRRVHFQEYLVFNTEPHTQKNGSHLTERAFNAVIYPITGVEALNGDEINNCNIKTGMYSPPFLLEEDKEIANLLLSTVTDETSNGIQFTTQFKTNVSAGAKSSELTANTARSLQVLYTDAGFIDYITPNFVSGYKPQDINISHNLPEIDPEYDFDANNQLYINFGKDRLDIYKDAREILLFTYEIQYVKENKDIIIGNQLKRSNPMVKDNVSVQPKIFVFDKKISKYLEKIRPEDGTEITGSINYTPFDENLGTSIGITFNEPLDNDIKSWVITDQNNNIILGMNEQMNAGDSETSTIYIQGYDNDYRNKK